MYKRNPYVETGGGGRGDVDVGIYFKLTSCATMKMTTMNFIHDILKHFNLPNVHILMTSNIPKINMLNIVSVLGREEGWIYGKIWSEPERNPEGWNHILLYIPT